MLLVLRLVKHSNRTYKDNQPAAYSMDLDYFSIIYKYRKSYGSSNSCANFIKI